MYMTVRPLLVVRHQNHSLQVLYSGKIFEGENFNKFCNLWSLVKVFSTKFGGVASFGTAKASNPRTFSLRKSYFSPIHESFLPPTFSGIRYGVSVFSKNVFRFRGEHGYKT